MEDPISEGPILKGHGATVKGLISERENERWDVVLTIKLEAGNAEPQYEKYSCASEEMARRWLRRQAEARGFLEVDDLIIDVEKME